jgi:colanic acid/amylovoran biosynthesis protein
MLDKGGEFWRRTYIPLVIESLEMITKNSSYDIKIIIHDRSKGDFDIAQLISKTIKNKTDVIDLVDPQEIKSIIAKSQFLISSRFHGLAVGLSNNVPSIAIGWSHKYFHLLNEYGLSEFVVSRESDANNLQKLIKQLMNDNERIKIRNKISEMNTHIQQRINSMWDKIMILSNSKYEN